MKTILVLSRFVPSRLPAPLPLLPRGVSLANPLPSPKDIITDDEMISDSYDLKEVNGIVYEADCAMITEGAVEISQ